MISKIYFALFIVLTTNDANGLRCNYCTSSSSMYNRDCHNGSNTLPSGNCPVEFTSCVTRYAEDANGNFKILRDCSSQSGLASWNYPIEITAYCDFDLCNLGYIEVIDSIPTTSTPLSSTSTEPSGSAIGVQNTIPIWILAFATAFRCI